MLHYLVYIQLFIHPRLLCISFLLSGIKKFNYLFVTQSLSIVRFFSIFPVKFTFSKMIPTVCFATTVSACFSILIQNILMHYVSSSMTTWQPNVSHSIVLHQKQPCLQLESAISPCFFSHPSSKTRKYKTIQKGHGNTIFPFPAVHVVFIHRKHPSKYLLYSLFLWLHFCFKAGPNSKQSMPVGSPSVTTARLTTNITAGSRHMGWGLQG